VVTHELHWVDARGQAELVRSGQVSAAELTQLAIERIEQLDPSVNAVVFRRFERARQEPAAGYDGVAFGGVRRWEERVGAVIDEMEPMPTLMVEFGQSVTGIQPTEAVDRLARWSRHVAAATSAFNVVLTPTMAILPPELVRLSGDTSLADMGAGLSGMTSFAIPFDVSGQPAISLPLSWAPNGLPIGVQLVAQYGREDVLFRLASQLEEAQPWADRHPDLAWAN